MALQHAHTLAGAQVPYPNAAVHRGGEELQPVNVWVELDQSGMTQRNIFQYKEFFPVTESEKQVPPKLEAYCMTPDDPLRLWVQYCFTTSHSFMVPSQPPARHHEDKQHLSGHGNKNRTDACWIKKVIPPKTTDLWPGGWRLNQRPCWQQEQCEWPSTSDYTEPASSPTASAAELG